MLGPYARQPGLCVPWWGEGLGAGQWGLEGGPREGTVVGGGEMTWGGRGEGFHSQEGWWRRPRPPGKWGAIVEWCAEGKATIATPFPVHQPGLLGQWQGHTPEQAHPPLKPEFPTTTWAPASLLGCWA